MLLKDLQSGTFGINGGYSIEDSPVDSKNGGFCITLGIINSQYKVQLYTVGHSSGVYIRNNIFNAIGFNSWIKLD